MTNDLVIDDSIIISVDYTKARQLSENERLDSVTALFLALTKAINNGYDVDMSDFQNIRITKK